MNAARPVRAIRPTAVPDPADVARYRAEGMWSTDAVDAVAGAATTHPDRTALVDRTGRLSYGDLDRRVDAAAARLQDAGVVAGEPVVLLAANTARAVIAFHALRRRGATVVLLAANLGRAELDAVGRRVEARFVVAPSATGSVAAGDPAVQWLSLDAVTGAKHARDGRASTATRSPDEPRLVLFTSGTTSVPKGVLHSENTLRVAAENYIAAAGLGPDDGLLLVSPIASITGVLQALVMAPAMGARVILEDHWDDRRTFDLLVQERGTFYGGPDVVIGRLLAEATRRQLTELPIRAVSVGGTVLDDALLRRAEDEFGIVVMRAYGSSEAPFSTTTPRGAPRAQRLALDGVPLRGVTVRIGTVNDPGECAVKGPHVFLGYLDVADNDDAFDAGWFCTGDRGELTDGNLKISGRLKEIVIRNGLKVSLAEVETAAAKLPFVAEAAAFRRSDPATGERLALAVRPNPGATVDLRACVDGLLGLGLAKNRLPEELVLWDAPFPRTNTEKVQRDALAEQSAGRPRFLADRIRE